MTDGDRNKYRPKTINGGRPVGVKNKQRRKGFRKYLSISSKEIDPVKNLYRRATSLEPEGPEFEEWATDRAKYLLMAEARGEFMARASPVFNFPKERENLYLMLDFVLEMASKNGILSAIDVLEVSQKNEENLQAIKCLKNLLKDLESSDGWGVI